MRYNSGMNHRERIALVIEGQKADRIPRGELCIDDRLVAEHCGVTDVKFDQRLAFVSDLDLDLICLGAELDDHSSANTLPDPQTVQFPDLNRWANESGRFVFAMLDGALAWVSRMLGFHSFLTDLYRRPDEVSAMMNQAAEFNLELARKAAGQGAHGILIADDIAYTKGLMMSPDMLRQIFFPVLKKLVEQISALELPVFFHSDGNLNLIMDDLANTGLNGLQCLESAAGMDLHTIKQNYGRQLCLWGNLDPACLTGPLDDQGKQAIQEQVSTIQRTAEQGGIIFGTSSGLFHGIRLENLGYAYQCLSDPTEQAATVK